MQSWTNHTTHTIHLHMATKLRRQVIPGVGQEVVYQLDGDVGFEEADDLPGASVDGLLHGDIARQELDACPILGLGEITNKI